MLRNNKVFDWKQFYLMMRSLNNILKDDSRTNIKRP